MLVDSHCHLDFPDFADDLDAVMGRAAAAGVGVMLTINTHLTRFERTLAVAERFDNVWCTVGIHPHEAGTEPAAEVERLVELSRHPKVVGFGETGLDYFYEHAPRTAQRRAFAAQIALAHELDLALVIHARDAFEDVWEILRSEGVPPRTVIHCFTGTPADAEGCLTLGCDISIAGVVTFKNAAALREAVRLVPLDRLHVETDSPFLAPVPHRGRTNEPALVAVVGEFVAELRGEDPAELARATAANTARLFRLPSP